MIQLMLLFVRSLLSFAYSMGYPIQPPLSFPLLVIIVDPYLFPPPFLIPPSPNDVTCYALIYYDINVKDHFA